MSVRVSRGSVNAPRQRCERVAPLCERRPAMACDVALLLGWDIRENVKNRISISVFLLGTSKSDLLKMIAPQAAGLSVPAADPSWWSQVRPVRTCHWLHFLKPGVGRDFAFAGIWFDIEFWFSGLSCAARTAICGERPRSTPRKRGRCSEKSC